MHVPGLLERVRLSGLDEVYLVIGVDPSAQAADLMPIVYGRQTVKSVPFLVMEPIPGCAPPNGRPEHAPETGVS